MSNCKTKEILLLLAKAIEQNTINTYQEQGSVAADKVFKILEEAEKKIETLDVEEVVRCEECKHGDVSIHRMSIDGEEEIGCYCELKGKVTDVDYYCPSGERRDTE